MSNVIPIKPITPIEDDLHNFFCVVFGYSEGLIAFRSFPERGNSNSKPPTNIWVKRDESFINRALNYANLTNHRRTAFYVIPGIVAEAGKASSADIIEMQTLLVDIDDGNTEEKLQTLESTLGAATIVVESGGITKEGYAKLHIYWQLLQPARSKDLQKLLELRYQLALRIGGDIHCKSAHQPIRVADSVYHKGGIAKLVKIRRYEPLEYELTELIEKVRYLPNLSNNIPLIISSNKQISTILDFNTKTSSLSLPEIMTSKVYEGGNGEQTRFNHITKIIGYWLRRYHEGAITKEAAVEEIYSYNAANMVPPWQDERIKQTIEALWKLHVEKYGEPKKMQANATPSINSFSLDVFLNDHSELPQDLIAPRILTPGGMFVFGGASKVGKSDFLLSLFVHMAAGKEFLGFAPPKPLKIFYFQAEIGYHYLRERLQNMQLPAELVQFAKDNLYITPNNRLLLDEATIESVVNHIKATFDKPDIIAVDPIRNVFDGGRSGATENENDAMLFFLQKRIEALRDKVNPEAGIVFAHHTKKISRSQFDEDPFQAFSGASSLRGYYTSGALLYKPEIESNDRHLIFELRNGGEIPTKVVRKEQGQWIEDNPLNRPITNKHYNIKLSAERDRKDQLILDILRLEAARGRVYSINAFCEAFDGEKGLGSKDTIHARIKVLIRKGYIKFFKNTVDYGFGKCTSTYGLMCIKDMELLTKEGEIKSVAATHDLHHEFEELLRIETEVTWPIY